MFWKSRKNNVKLIKEEAMHSDKTTHNATSDTLA
jgi:hypothetical protein